MVDGCNNFSFDTLKLNLILFKMVPDGAISMIYLELRMSISQISPTFFSGLKNLFIYLYLIIYFIYFFVDQCNVCLL